jgi:hypothetical protein
MDVAEFWATVEDVRRGVAEEPRADEAIADRLVARLVARGTQPTLAFHRQFSRARGALARWDVWGAAYLLLRDRP